MTNGEVLQKTFPNNEIDTLSTKIVFALEPRTLRQQVFVFDKDWWNAEYKEPTTKNDKVDCEHTDCNNCINHKYCDYEPTTKNDLGVQFIDWNNCHTSEQLKSIATTKNDLAVDCISREQALEPYKILENTDTLSVYTIRQNLVELPSMGRYDPYTDKFIKE